MLGPAIRDNSGVVVRKWQKMKDNDESTLTLKPKGRVIRIPRQRISVAPQIGRRSNKTKEKNFKKEVEQV